QRRVAAGARVHPAHPVDGAGRYGGGEPHPGTPAGGWRGGGRYRAEPAWDRCASPVSVGAAGRHDPAPAGFDLVHVEAVFVDSAARLGRVGIPVLLSTSSVFPEPTAAAFEVAAKLGYDGVEVMVWTDAVSQDADALAGLARHYRMPVRSIHAPCLLVTQRVWSGDPVVRLRRSADLAAALGASVVVVHPPFTWQREYARGFRKLLEQLGGEYPGLRFAVENMYPVRMARRELVPYAPGWNPTEVGYDSYTLDISHCAAARTDALTMADAMGDGLAHVHLGDGTSRG